MRLRCLSLDPYRRHLSVIDPEKGKQLEFGTPADKPHRPSRNLSAKVILPELFAQVEVWERKRMTGATRLTIFWIVALGLALAPGVVEAHTEGAVAGGFISGFTHPILGWDHVVAMVAVGMWGAFLGPPAIWLLPVVFPLVMAFGAALGVMGVPIPAVETGIAGSAVVLGLMILLAAKLPLWAASIIVAFFAVFHGHAHGVELPEATNSLAYAAGFVIATGLLHLIGIAFGLLIEWPLGYYAVRAGGGVISVIGLAFLFGIV